MIGKEEINHRFGTHKATIEGPAATAPAHAQLRMNFKHFAEILDQMLADGREKSVAFTELENASMWAHKALAKIAPLIDESESSKLGFEVKDGDLAEEG